MAKMLSSMILGNSDLSEFGDKRINSLNQSKRLPAIILVDTSGSMDNYESLLKKSVESLYDEILKNRTASNATELSVMTFNSDIEILEKMREIKSQESKGRNLNFHCEGVTLTGLALKAAISQLEARKRVYATSSPKVKYFAPIIFLVSDGYPYCDNATVLAQEEAAMSYSRQYIQQEVAANRLVVVTVEVGDKCDHNLMRELTGLNDDKHVTKVNNATELANFFKLTSSFIISLSQSNTDSNVLNKTSFKDMK